MIVAERKPMAEIIEMVKDCKKVLVLACRGCVTVCSAGGEREAEILSSLIRLGMKKAGKTIEITTGSLVRQCDREYIDEIDQWDGEYDAVVSTACGVGVNFISNLRKDTMVYPALNTTFLVDQQNRVSGLNSVPDVVTVCFILPGGYVQLPVVPRA